MRNHFMYWLEHVDCRCGHVSIWLFVYIIQFGLGVCLAIIYILWWLVVYWVYRSFSVLITHALDIPVVVYPFVYVCGFGLCHGKFLVF